ncbi:S9 family peptidase [bacterium]|nr:S9 family peptidase [bacterium]
MLISMSSPSFSQGGHPFSVHDMLAMDRISDPQVSPDGNWIVFVLRKTDLEANRGRTDLWLIRIDGSGLKQLTTNPASDFNPRWKPDGNSILFLSTRSGSSQIWRLQMTGGEAQRITDLPLDAGNLVLGPNGKLMAFSMDVFIDCEDLSCTSTRLQERESSKSSGMIFEQLFIRHWDTWKDGRRSHIFVMPMTGGDPVDIMAGMDADSPTKPFGGPEDMTFTPDGQSIVFTARNVGRQEAWSTDFDLYLSPVDGTQLPQCLTEANQAWDSHPAFSPDGKTMAYTAMTRPGYESDRFRIILRDWPNGEERVLTEDWDRSVGSIVWSTDSRTIFTTASNLGQTSLFAVSVTTSDVETIVRDGRVSSPSMAGDRMVYGRSSLQSPVELFSVSPDGGDVRTITRINEKKINAAQIGDYEQFTFKGWKNETVYCYVVKPVDFDANKKYPVAFLIHGGPQGSFGNNFHYRWNPQAYAGAGYGVAMVDFHGSVGYGQKFTDSINNDWGGKPLEDLKKGLAAALARYPWMDGANVAALGASYGGYMINWIAGNWPERFRCLVNHDGLFDTRSMYFETEELWFPEWDTKGTPWTNPKGYRDNNPVEFVKNWKTPMLVIHGALDFRVVESQGLSTFTALQRRGVPSKLLYFSDENHFVLKPHNSIQWHETVISWLDQWCKPEATN